MVGFAIVVWFVLLLAVLVGLNLFDVGGDDRVASRKWRRLVGFAAAWVLITLVGCIWIPPVVIFVFAAAAAFAKQLWHLRLGDARHHPELALTKREMKRIGLQKVMRFHARELEDLWMLWWFLAAATAVCWVITVVVTFVHHWSLGLLMAFLGTYGTFAVFVMRDRLKDGGYLREWRGKGVGWE